MPYRRPCKGGFMNLQINKVTRKAYNGKNQAILLHVKEERGYTSDEWVTFVQVRDNIGGRLVGAKGKGIMLSRPVGYREENAKGEMEDKKGLKRFFVFNCDHLEVGDNK